MALGAGARLGPYEIVSPLGTGGMGEIFRARDSRLNRFVAIKILTIDLASDPDARERFRVEARAISSLSHPNICTLHDIGEQDGVDFLVMELLEGETLAARLARGPLPLDQLLRTAEELAAGLDAAHAKGITHRDLKPGNVMLTKTGAKLLDFGLAKPHARGPATALETRSFDPPITAEGSVLGTFPYMAPEQLEGLDVDARSDLFAFGAVLYEMATGRRAFEGRTQASLTAAILEREPPPVSSVRRDLPPAFDYLVARCLAKSADHRWQSAHDLVLQLRWMSDVTSSPQPLPARSSRVPALAWLIALTFLVAAGGFFLGRRSSSPPTSAQLDVALPAETILQSIGSGTNLALSPDGRTIVIAASRNGQTELWLRPLNAAAPRRLPGTEGARLPFWSPDSRFVGFVAGPRILRIDLNGGMPQAICEARVEGAPSWGRRGSIIFSDTTAIYRVPASGGVPAKVTSVDRSRNEREHFWPAFLPDGRRFLFLVGIAEAGGSVFRHHVYLADTEDAVPTPLFAAESRTVFANGYMLYVQGGTLQARRFDLSTLTVAGDPQPIAERVWYFKANGLAEFSVSDTGAVAFHGGTSDTELVWFDRSGRQTGRLGSRAAFLGPRLSHDGRKVAVAVDDWRTGAPDVWIYDRDSGIPSRFTTDPRLADSPVWSPDGQFLVFRSALDGAPDLFRRRADGRGGKERLAELTGIEVPYDVSPDGSRLIFADSNRQTRNDLWLLPFDDADGAKPYLRTPFDETDARFSPDGRWIAFMSNETGNAEVYVAALDDPGAKQRISLAGGAGPRWRGDGREIVYLSAEGMLMAVPLELGPHLRAGAAKPLFAPGPVFAERSGNVGNPSFDMSADGSSLLVNRVVHDASLSPVRVVLNWPALVAAREP